MSVVEPVLLTRETLLDYFLRAVTPRKDWMVGIEVEKMGRRSADGRPIPYTGGEASVRKTLEFLRERRGGDPVYEGDHLIGLDGPWGAISLEPGGQVEWSSRPQATLEELAASVDEHLAAMRDAGESLGITWLSEAVDPHLALSAMPWMPKARYGIMRPFLGARGRLAHRMMTQTASIQCAFDYEDAEDWRRKFKSAALMAPVATALFANSSLVDGGESGYRCYRQAIWNETDPDRCGLPGIVFEDGFGLESWMGWVLDVPTIFRHRARGLVPAGGVPFSRLMQYTACDAVTAVDWESHISTIFTDVRSYTYIEVRSADLQPDDRILAVPALWTGLLYHDDSLEAVLELARDLDDYAAWRAAMEAAARHGLDATAGDERIRAMAAEALSVAIRGLAGGAACVGDPAAPVASLEALARRHDLKLRA